MPSFDKKTLNCSIQRISILRIDYNDTRLTFIFFTFLYVQFSFLFHLVLTLAHQHWLNHPGVSLDFIQPWISHEYWIQVNHSMYVTLNFSLNTYIVRKCFPLRNVKKWIKQLKKTSKSIPFHSEKTFWFSIRIGIGCCRYRCHLFPFVKTLSKIRATFFSNSINRYQYWLTSKMLSIAFCSFHCINHLKLDSHTTKCKMWDPSVII